MVFSEGRPKMECQFVILWCSLSINWGWAVGEMLLFIATVGRILQTEGNLKTNYKTAGLLFYKTRRNPHEFFGSNHVKNWQTLGSVSREEPLPCTPFGQIFSKNSLLFSLEFLSNTAENCMSRIFSIYFA